MTAEQLTALGIPTNKWISLDGVFKGFLFSQEGKHFTYGPDSTQFYFDADSNLLFVRYTNDKRFSDKRSKEFSVEISPGKYAIPLSGGVIDPAIGVFHEIFSIPAIVEFF